MTLEQILHCYSAQEAIPHLEILIKQLTEERDKSLRDLAKAEETIESLEWALYQFQEHGE